MKISTFGLSLLAAALYCLLLSSTCIAQSTGDDATVDELLRRGRTLLAEDDFAGAVDAFEKAAALDPTNRTVLYFLGRARYASGDEEGAREVLRQRNAVDADRALAQLFAEGEDELATTAEEVIELHLEAIGGREAVAAVKTMVVTFSGHSTYGRIARMRRQYKRPNRYRAGVVDGPRFTATDGTTVWRVDGDEWREINDTAYLHLASIDGHFLEYESRGIRYDFVGIEIFNDTPVYHLLRTFADGFEEELYFSIDKGYLTEIVSDYPAGNPTMKSTASLWDYRDVGGISIPHVFIRNMGDIGPPHGIVVEAAQVNVPLDDGLFSPPGTSSAAGATRR